MFILDLYRYVESFDWTTRQHIAKFIYSHRDCERMAKSAGLTRRQFASVASREFVCSMCACGYIDMRSGRITCAGSTRRPCMFEFKALQGEENPSIWLMLHLDEIDDHELFK